VRRDLRLRKRKDFGSVYGARSARGARLLVLHVLHGRPGARPHPRIGFAIPKKVGGAVTRNLIKRRLRAIATAALKDSAAPLDLVVVARPEAATATFAELDSEFKGLLGRVLPLSR
jgi:ribonuclease P protein component